MLLSVLWLLLLAQIAPSGSAPEDDSSNDDAADDSDDNTGQETDDADEDSDDDVRDPEKQRLSREAAKWRKRFREAEAQIQALEADTGKADALRAARLETAFLREVLARPEPIADLETAWDLATVRGFLDPVKIKEDGAVTGMPEAMDRLLARYPYLLDENDEEPARPLPSIPSGRQVIGASRAPGPDQAGLRNRFPALRRGRT